MSLQDSLFFEDVEDDVTTFTKNKTRKRALIFPPVNNYRRYIIHQLVQERFSDLLHTFSIGQGAARRTVVCYKSNLRRDWEPRPNAPESKVTSAAEQADATNKMGVEGRRSSSASPEHTQVQRQAKSIPAVEIYRPPAARKANNCSQMSGTHMQMQATADSPSVKNTRQKRPDRAVYVPRHRRSLEAGEKRSGNPNTNNNSKVQDAYCTQQSASGSSLDDKMSESGSTKSEDNRLPLEFPENVISADADENLSHETPDYVDTRKPSEVTKEDVPILPEQTETVATISLNESSTNLSLLETSDKIEVDDQQLETMQLTVTESQPIAERLSSSNTTADKNERLVKRNMTSDVLIISDTVEKETKHTEQVPAILTSPEKKVKKIERPKSKPAAPPSPPLKINRDECDWDSLFDDNGDCLDPTLIEELTSAVGEVMVEQPKNDYKAYTKQVQVSSDEFAHVVEIYNFPSDFKTSDLAAVFSPFRNGGFELKWVDDTHCLGVFSSPLIAAEVLASNHPFVKTRPLSEASALSKMKARKSAEFLQPYRNRPETCPALARRLVTSALGVKLATARQEREHEKTVLREAKEKKRLANQQRENIWEGIIPEK